MRFSVSLVVLVLFTQPVSPAEKTAKSWNVFFSPSGGCTEAITNELANAKRTVLVQAYSFTSAPIAKAVVDAYKRGVKVTVILDKSQRTQKYSSADFLRNAGVPTHIDAKHAIAHNKVMVIDGQTVLTGSFNFTKAAEESNAENLLVVQDPALAAKYTTNWQAHLSHSEKYTSNSFPFCSFAVCIFNTAISQRVERDVRKPNRQGRGI